MAEVSWQRCYATVADMLTLMMHGSNMPNQMQPSRHEKGGPWLCCENPKAQLGNDNDEEVDEPQITNILRSTLFWLVVEPTHLKNMLVNLEIFPK